MSIERDSNSLPDSNNNNNIHHHYNKITVESKIIDRFSQLNSIQKERVILAFKEAAIKGFDIDGIPVFIKSKLGIIVSPKFVKALRRYEIIDNRKWYINLAKDKFAYISVYRKCIDELEQIRQECWRMIMRREVDFPTKVQCLREIHNVVKTQVLLVRDLPFIMNLSKYYDPKLIDPNGDGISRLAKNNNFNDKENNTKVHPLNSYLHKTVFDAVNNNNNRDIPEHVSLPHKVLEEAPLRRAERFKNVDDDIMREMQTQLHGLSELDKEAIRKEEEQRTIQEDEALAKTIREFEDDLRGEFKTSLPGGHLSLSKVKELQRKAESSINYLDNIISEKERETVKRLRDISE